MTNIGFDAILNRIVDLYDELKDLQDTGTSESAKMNQFLETALEGKKFVSSYDLSTLHTLQSRNEGAKSSVQRKEKEIFDKSRHIVPLLEKFGSKPIQFEYSGERFIYGKYLATISGEGEHKLIVTIAVEE
jgi:hypothetical protein